MNREIKKKEQEKGGIAKYNQSCRNESCVWNVSMLCKKSEINGKFCIGYTNN